MSERIDSASRVIHAPPQTIYAALTDGDAVARWMPPDGMSGEIVAFEPRPGGAYAMVLRYDDPAQSAGKTDANSDRVDGTFVALEANRSVEQAIRFVSGDPAFAGTMRMLWTLEPASDGTVLTVSCSNVPAGIDPAVHEQALGETLANLTAYLGR